MSNKGLTSIKTRGTVDSLSNHFVFERRSLKVSLFLQRITSTRKVIGRTVQPSATLAGSRN